MNNIIMEVFCNEDYTLKKDSIAKLQDERSKEAFWEMMGKLPLPERFVELYIHEMNIEDLIESDNLTKELILKNMDLIMEYLVSDEDVMENVIKVSNLIDKLSDSPVEDFSMPLLNSLYRVKSYIFAEFDEHGLSDDYKEEYGRRFEIVESSILQSSIQYISSSKNIQFLHLNEYTLTVYLMTNTNAIPLESVHYDEISTEHIKRVVNEFSDLIVDNPNVRVRVFEFITRHNIAKARKNPNTL